MTREQAKEILPIIEAFSKGKTVERFNPCNGEWDELKNPSFDLDNSFYRIKREPKCRPFKSQEECWNEMLKHQPFGWVRTIISDNLYLIESISHEVFCNRAFTPYKEAFAWFKFADGTPFGVKEE